MNRLSWMFWGCAAMVGCTAMVGCVAGGGSSVEDDGAGGAGATGSGGDPGTGASGASGGFNSVGGSGGSPNLLFEVYGHGPNELFRLDPTNNNLVTLVGPFTDCASGIIDIAIDKDNNILGVSTTALWNINRDNGSCTKIADGSFPNSLSFVPEGTLDATKEALVGYEVANYVRIDPVNGNKQIVTTTALTGNLESSGDIVSVDGGADGNATYLTVRGPGCTDLDCLVEIDPVSGAIVQNFGSVGFNDVFGLAFWGGSAYGFAREGDVFEITFNGTTVSSQAITIPNKPSGLEFWGAGSSTLVPLLPPQ